MVVTPGGVGAFWVEVIDNVMFEAIFDALMARLAACLCVFGCSVFAGKTPAR